MASSWDFGCSNHLCCVKWSMQTHINVVTVFSHYKIVNNLNPVQKVATIYHQVCCMCWGHPSVFHAAISLLNWYKMVCIANILHRLIWVKFISMLSMYVQSETQRHFHWRIIAFFNTKFYCSDVGGYHRHPQALAEVCRNMGICCCFRAVATRGKHLGFMLFLQHIHNRQAIWDIC